MKENDIVLNMLANPKFTLEDFQAVGLNSDNTGLQTIFPSYVLRVPDL